MRTGTSRRVFMGAAGLLATSAVAPALAVAVTSPNADRQAWDQAYRAYETARLSDERINALYKASTPAQQDELDDEWNASGERLGDAEWALFETPAPDLAALEWKLAMLRERGLAFETDLADTLLADVRRLKGERA